MQQLAERLAARIGNEYIHGLRSVAEHRPQYAWRAENVLAGQRSAAGGGKVVPVRRPLWMLPEPEPLTVRGPVLARLFAETTGSDADWVVKLIDVYAGVEEDFVMSGFQLMISGDIFRGRYREDYERSVPIRPDTALEYRIPLPHVNHCFLPGHRIMVQVQSSWFPLFDRNPQTFVPNIFEAREEDFVKATQRVWHAPGAASRLEVMVLPSGAGREVER